MLSPHGHVEHHFVVTDLGGIDLPGHRAGRRGRRCSATWTACGSGPRSRWPTRPPSCAVLSLAGPPASHVARAGLTADLPARPTVATALPGGGFVRHTDAGIDLLSPRRARPRSPRADRRRRGAGRQLGRRRAADPHPPAALGVDTDDRTIPNEVGWLRTAVHLDKGCYRGQETVARVHNLGRPPRRLVMLNLDGSAGRAAGDRRPGHTADGRTVGRVGTVAQHHEDGPIALALVKRIRRRRHPAAGRRRRRGHRPGDALGRGRPTSDPGVRHRPARVQPDPAELIGWVRDLVDLDSIRGRRRADPAVRGAHSAAGLAVAGSVAQAGEPAADRRVQDPRRGHRDRPARPGRAGPRGARAFVRQPRPGRRLRGPGFGIDAHIVIPDNAPARKIAGHPRPRARPSNWCRSSSGSAGPPSSPSRPASR